MTHGVDSSGPASGLYRLLVRRSFTSGISQALAVLAKVAEAGPPPRLLSVGAEDLTPCGQ